LLWKRAFGFSKDLFQQDNCVRIVSCTASHCASRFPFQSKVPSTTDADLASILGGDQVMPFPHEKFMTVLVSPSVGARLSSLSAHYWMVYGGRRHSAHMLLRLPGTIMGPDRLGWGGEAVGTESSLTV
jgi:hypothetical protein